MEPTTALAIAIPISILGGLAAWIGWLWYRSAPGAALASVALDGAAPFSLEYTVQNARAHRIWLRSRYVPEAGVTLPAIVVDLRVTATPPAGERVGYRTAGGARTLHAGEVTAGGKSQWSESPHAGRKAQTLWVVPGQPPGTTLSIEGACRPDTLAGYAGLEVFVATR